MAFRNGRQDMMMPRVMPNSVIRTVLKSSYVWSKDLEAEVRNTRRRIVSGMTLPFYEPWLMIIEDFLQNS